MRRRGFLLHEAMMAVALSMALAAGIAQLLVTVSRQRSLTRQRSVATQEAANLMEVAISRPWSDTTADSMATLELSNPCTACLPDANLSVHVAEEEAGIRRITVQIQWQAASERPQDSVRLVGWRFHAEEDES